MTKSGGDIIADIIKAHEVPFVFALCGGHISPILVSCKERGIGVIDVRDEKNAVFAADAFARFTGIPGIAVVTAGPGVTNTITAMKNAQMAQSPVILLGGSAATVIKGRGSLQDIDQISLVQSIVKEAVTINQNCDIVPVLENAFHVAQSGTPGPVFIECPIDLLYSEEAVREWYGKSDADEAKGIKSRLFRFYLDRHVNKMFACDFEAMKPDPKLISIPDLKAEKVQKAVSMLEKAKNPLMVIGSQSMLCQSRVEELVDAVDKLGIPYYLTGMARGLMGSSHPLHMRHQRSAALKKADLVILAGMPCDFRLGYGRSINSKADLISANRNREDLNLNRKPDLGILADPCEFLIDLARQSNLRKERFESWCRELIEADQVRDDSIAKMGREKLAGINPILFFQQLNAFLEDESVIVADGGDFVATASYILRPRKPLSWIDPGAFGTLGVGAGFAMGAKLSRSDSEVWLIYGDGAAGYSLLEVDTFIRHGLPVIAVIGNDGSWAQIARDQVVLFDDDVGTVLNRSHYHKVFEGFGAKGLLLEREEDIPGVLQEAREHARKGIPVCINVMIGTSDFRKGSISM